MRLCIQCNRYREGNATQSLTHLLGLTLFGLALLGRLRWCSLIEVHAVSRGLCADVTWVTPNSHTDITQTEANAPLLVAAAAAAAGPVGTNTLPPAIRPGPV